MPLDPSRMDPKVSALGIRNEAALLVAQRSINQTLAAQRLAISKQTHSEWLKEHGARAAQVCAAHGIKWVPAADPYVDNSTLAALGFFARKGIDKVVPALPEAMLNGGGVVDDEPDTVRGDDV